MDGSQFVPSSIDGNLGCFQFGEIENFHIENCHKHAYSFFVCTNEMFALVRLLGHLVKCMLNIKRNCETALPNGSTILHSQQ